MTRMGLALAATGGLFFGLTTQVLYAAPIVVGTVNSNNCLPFMCNFSGSSVGPSIQYQQVYSADAFSGPTVITSETFYLDRAPDMLLGGTYVFSLSTTSATINGLDPVLDNNIGADNTQILSITIPPGGNRFGMFRTFDNTMDFLYDPAEGNLLLNLTVFNQDNASDGNGFDQADLSGDQTSRAWAYNGEVSGFSDSLGLVTSFNGAVPIPEPSSLLLLAGGLVGFAGVLRRNGRRHGIGEARRLPGEDHAVTCVSTRMDFVDVRSVR